MPKRNEVQAKMTNITVTLEGNGLKRTYILSPRRFDTGSVGYNLNDKADMNVGEDRHQLQIGGNFTIVGSKKWPE